MRPDLAPQEVLVLLGGPSAEHDVSLVSGRAIAAALSERGHVVRAMLIGLDGGWWRLPAAALDPGLPATAFDRPSELGAEGPVRGGAALERFAADHPGGVVFPALHGPFGEDGTVQALVEAADLVCCGSGVAASALGMDKSLFKRLCGAIELPVLPWIEVSAADHGLDPRSVIADVEAFAQGLPDPRVVVKPARMGSSIGISIVQRPDEPPELEAAIALAFRFDDLVLVEAYLDHPRELEVAVLGNGRADLEVHGPGEVVPGREFYDYEAKYRSASSSTSASPALDETTREDVRRIAAEAFLAIGASGFARVDFLLARDEVLFLSEINTVPGFTPISLFPMLCAAGGHDFGDTSERIVALALDRARARPARRLTRGDLP